MAPQSILAVISWGQYLHWADLQCERFRSLPESVSEPDRIGVVAHWLAAEHVVLEGWRQLSFKDPTIDMLLELYPEHCEALRRCRNGVYHFQNELLDRRIAAFLLSENEQLSWATALHFEFQRFLLHYPYQLEGSWVDCHELAKEIRAAIGWTPTQSPPAQQLKAYEKAMAFLEKIRSETSQHAADARAAVAASLDEIEKIDVVPLTQELSRIRSKRVKKSDA